MQSDQTCSSSVRFDKIYPVQRLQVILRKFILKLKFQKFKNVQETQRLHSIKKRQIIPHIYKGIYSERNVTY